MLDVWKDEKKSKTVEVIEDKDFKRLSSSFGIMTINMNGDGGTAGERRNLIVSTIKRSPASVIFCQEVPGSFEKVATCGNDGPSYKFVRPNIFFSGPNDFRRRKLSKVAVMWRETDFQGKEVDLEDSSIKEIVERLGKDPNVDVSEIRTRTAMVKLRCKTTKVSFLAVSWHGPRCRMRNATTTKELEPALKRLDGLVWFSREVCEKEKLSSFIIGGDFNLITSIVDLTQYKGVTVWAPYELCARDEKRLAEALQQKPGQFCFIPYKDTFIVSVTVPSDKRLMAEDITVPLAAPLEPKNERSKIPLLDHEPVFKLVRPRKKHFIKQDRGKLEQHLIYSRAFFWPTFVYITKL